MITKDAVLARMAFEREQAAALGVSKARVSKAEDKAEYYDIATDLDTTDKERMPSRRVGDAHLVQSKVVYMPETTRTYQTAGDMAVPRDSFLSPNLGESQKPTQEYRCEYPDGQKLHGENVLSPGESEGVTPADYVPSKPAVLKRAAGMFSNIIHGQTGDGIDAADRFTGGK
jgi:hypothetical protein